VNNEYKNRKNGFPRSIFKKLKCGFPSFQQCHIFVIIKIHYTNVFLWNVIVLFLIHYNLQIPKIRSNIIGIIQNKIKKRYWVELIKPLLKRPYKMDYAKQALRPISCSKVQSNFMYTYQGWF
jgi:hypothetical protein